MAETVDDDETISWHAWTIMTCHLAYLLLLAVDDWTYKSKLETLEHHHGRMAIGRSRHPNCRWSLHQAQVSQSIICIFWVLKLNVLWTARIHLRFYKLAHDNNWHLPPLRPLGASSAQWPTSHPAARPCLEGVPFALPARVTSTHHRCRRIIVCKQAEQKKIIWSD